MLSIYAVIVFIAVCCWLEMRKHLEMHKKILGDSLNSKDEVSKEEKQTN